MAREPEDLARSFHRRASAWFGGQGLLPEAIQHALAAGVVDEAAGWIEMLTPTLLARTSIRQALQHPALKPLLEQAAD